MQQLDPESIQFTHQATVIIARGASWLPFSIDFGQLANWTFLTVLFLLFTPRTVRTLYYIVARPFGLANPDHFHRWIILPWRPVLRRVVRILTWVEQNFAMGKKATAKWLDFLQRCCLVYSPGRVLYGRQHLFGLPLFQPVGEECERHQAMIAGTGSGKTTTLITLLSLHQGTAFVVDPKAQMFNAMKERCGDGGGGVLGKKKFRGMDRQVAALDPYGLCDGHRSQCWNVIDEIGHAAKRHGPDAAPRYASKIAEGFVTKPPRENNPFFTNNARMFIQALLLFVYVALPPDERHIIRFRELLCAGLPPQGPIVDPMMMLLFEMEQRRDFDGIIAAAATSLRTTSDKARGDILGTAREQTKWLDLPEIRSISTRSDFALEDLKNGALSLFVCAPATDIRSMLSGWFRILAVLGLYVFENIPGRLEHPCYWALDEMPSLGHIQAVETAAPLMRGYGVRLLCVTQGLDDLEAVYPETWRKFLGNADAVYWMGMGAADTRTHEELGKILGTTTRKEKIGGGWRSNEKKRYQKVERPLVYPEQIPRLLAGNNIIVTRYNQRHLLLKGVKHFKELPVTHYAADPQYGEQPLRACARRVCTHWFRKKIGIEEAMQIFGLAPGYSRQDVESRYVLLIPKCQLSREFRHMVRRARVVLLKGLVA